MGKSSIVSLLYDHVNARFIKYIQEGTDSLIGVAAKLRNVAGTIVNPATEDMQQSTVDTGNSSTSQLAVDAVFTGTGVDCLSYSAVSVIVHSDVSSAVNGMQFQFSMDNTNWDSVKSCTFDISLLSTVKYELPILARYFRFVYTNNSDDATTEFRVQTILHRQTLNFEPVKSGPNLKVDQDGIIVASETEEGLTKWLQSNAEGRLKVITGEQAEEPLHVIISVGKRSYYHLNLVDSDEPAEINTGADEPYDVGGTTLTITINGTGDSSSFPTRAAQAGIHYSASHPATENGNHKKLKVSVDGGAQEEVEIAEDLTSGAAIAAALQAEIRANVENGTNVTVEYNTVDYPFRYVFKSGTTGSSSIMHVEKGGDDLAKDIFVGAFGGTERNGLDADYYWAFEVIEQMEADLADVVIYQEGDGIHVQTVAGGTSATLQVTAGGANTALQFPTTLVTGVTGSGDDNLAVDGSSTSVRFSITPPTTEVFVVDKIIFFIRDNGAALNKFGGLDPLTNGVKLEVKSEELPLIPYVTAITNADLITQADDGEVVDGGFASGGQDLVKATFDFSPGLRLQQDTAANVYVTVQDDLTDLDSFFVRARGWVEAPAE